MLMKADARWIPLADESVHCVCTSPPYWGLRDYDLPPSIWGGDPTCSHEWAEETHDGCVKCGALRGVFGLEPTPDLYVCHLIEIFRDVRRVLRKDGTVWLNMGDSFTSGNRRGHGTRLGYKQETNRGSLQLQNWRPPLPTGLKNKDLCLIPFRVALALQEDGWWIRQVNIWHKPNPMPESVKDRPGTSHEYVFLLSKRARYYYDNEAVRQPLKPKTFTTFGTMRKSKGADALGKVKAHNFGRGAMIRKPARAQDGQIAGANLRSVWKVATVPFAEAHYAVFPPKLIENPIRAGTSDHGACNACGSPYRRAIQKPERLNPKDYQGKHRSTDAHSRARRLLGHTRSARESTGAHDNPFRAPEHMGWEPACRCNAGVVPCVVLDPFVGSGTTVLVAEQLGRTGIGLDLGYQEIARRRTAKIQKKLVGW